MKRKDNNGFSLVELMIVIAIMAILVAIIAPNLTKYLGKSKKNTDKKNADEIAAQLHNCITDYEAEYDRGLLDSYPGSITVSWDPSLLYHTTPVNADFDKIINQIVTVETESKEVPDDYAKATITSKGDELGAGYTIKVEVGNTVVTK